MVINKTTIENQSVRKKSIKFELNNHINYKNDVNPHISNNTNVSILIFFI